MSQPHINAKLRTMLAVLTVLGLLMASSAFAQNAGFGGISGVVTDSSGAVISAAQVKIDNDAKGIHRNLDTTGSGVFKVDTLVPADGYVVTIAKSGFANYQVKDITVNVGEMVTLSPKLNVAGSASSIEVTAAPPVIDDTKTDNSTLVDSKQIQELPINGRRVDSFVLLTPGVTSDGTFGLISFRGNPGGNSFLTDGNDTTNQFYDENAGRTRTFNIAQDAVQEFQVVTSNFLAEYGKASGGVINTVTRSGTNSYHGTAYEFWRNRTLNATDITAGGLNPPEWRHQAGLSVGGPIKKDKLFFFFNGELQRRNAPIVSSNLAGNTMFDASGNFIPTNCAPAAIPAGGTATPTPAQCAAAASYIQSRVAFQLVPRNMDVNLLFGKVDYRLNDKNNFSFSGNYLDFRSPNGIQTQLSLTNGNALGNNANTNVYDRTGRASWTSIISPNAVNEVRYGIFKDRQFDDLSLSLLPPFGPINLSVQGTGNLGFAAGYPRLNPSELRNQLADTFTWNFGAHSLKFGIDWDHVEDYVFRNGNLFGTYSYPSFAAFALDFSGNATNAKSYSSFSQTFGNPVVDVAESEIAFFAQDQWRLTPKLSFDYGLRYEHTFLPTPTVTNPLFPQTASIPDTNLGFAPRVGLAYSIDQKTVVRAGYGLFYNRYPSSTIENFFVTNGVYQQNFSLRPGTTGTGPAQTAAGPVFPSGLASAPGAVAGSASVLFPDPNFRNAYSHQASLAVEREIVKNTTMSVSYVWSRSAHLLQTLDANAADPGACPQSATLGRAGNCYTYGIMDTTGAQVGTYTSPLYTTRPNAAFGTLAQLQSGGNSYYNGLLVNVNSHFNDWISGGIAYTYSHAIDDAQGGGGNTLFGSTFPTTAIYNGQYNLEKGSSSSDQRHRLVLNAVLSPRLMHSDNAFARYVANGWQLSVVDLMASSYPITPSLFVAGGSFVNNTGFGAAGGGGVLSTSTLNGLGGSFRVPFDSISALDMGDTYRTDARITKQFPVNERVKVNVGFEAFNVFNHPIVTGRNAQEYTASRNASITLPAGSCGVGVSPCNPITISPVTRVGSSKTVGGPNYGAISATQGAPDGTSARRAQAVVRIIF